MTSQCPRCAAPRLGDFPFCHICGLDMRYAAPPAMPPQQPLPAQQPLYAAQPPVPTNYYQPAPPQAPVQQPYATPPVPSYYRPDRWLPVPAASLQPTDIGTPPAATATSVPSDSSATTDQPPATQASQPVTAPSVCLRCYSPLHPGYSQCSNCGFDNATAWTVPGAGRAQTPMLPVALAILGAGLVVAAGAIFLVAR